MASVFLMTNSHYQAKNVQQSALLRGVISQAWQEECEARVSYSCTAVSQHNELSHHLQQLCTNISDTEGKL